MWGCLAQEREQPALLAKYASRRRRVAQGSGRTEKEVGGWAGGVGGRAGGQAGGSVSAGVAWQQAEQE